MLFFIALGVTIFSCNSNTQSEGTEQEVALGDLQQGPIRNDALSEEQLESIKFIHEAFIEVLPISLEETTESFKRDQNPDTEINVWLNMAKAYQSVLSADSGFSDLNKKTEVFKLILMRSMLSEEEAIEAAELKLLTTEEIKEVLGKYALDAQPLMVE